MYVIQEPIYIDRQCFFIGDLEPVVVGFSTHTIVTSKRDATAIKRSMETVGEDWVMEEHKA